MSKNPQSVGRVRAKGIFRLRGGTGGNGGTREATPLRCRFTASLFRSNENQQDNFLSYRQGINTSYFAKACRERDMGGKEHGQ